MWLKILHFLGLTNLSDQQIQVYEVLNSEDLREFGMYLLEKVQLYFEGARFRNKQKKHLIISHEFSLRLRENTAHSVPYLSLYRKGKRILDLDLTRAIMLDDTHYTWFLIEPANDDNKKVFKSALWKNTCDEEYINTLKAKKGTDQYINQEGYLLVKSLTKSETAEVFCFFLYLIIEQHSKKDYEDTETTHKTRE